MLLTVKGGRELAKLGNILGIEEIALTFVQNGRPEDLKIATW